MADDLATIHRPLRVVVTATDSKDNFAVRGPAEHGLILATGKYAPFSRWMRTRDIDKLGARPSRRPPECWR